MSEVKVNKISPRTNCGTVQLEIVVTPLQFLLVQQSRTMERRQVLVEQVLLIGRQLKKQLLLQQLSGEGYFCRYNKWSIYM